MVSLMKKMKPSGLTKKFSLKSRKAATASSNGTSTIEKHAEEEKPVVVETDAIMESRDNEETVDLRKQDPAQMEDIDDKLEQNCDKFIVEDREEAKGVDDQKDGAENAKEESVHQKDDDSVVTEVANEADEPVDKALSTVKEESNEDETVNDTEAKDEPAEDEPPKLNVLMKQEESNEDETVNDTEAKGEPAEDEPAKVEPAKVESPDETSDDDDAQQDSHAKEDFSVSSRSRCVDGNVSIDGSTFETGDNECTSPVAKTSFCGFAYCFGGGLN
eukprot:CAMPEP_0171446632 /NCGR_PEP_ID=MMETSP0881-20121228/38695_1 /TAXON_ID=67004 /ORGANISM="Thalassiosira weissflogii, Strain CCMP1336" /LENGTH=273 /DNA_ID=CAMNT_0011971025 /DNA_START=85 /DNA_END=907 /DNA_ORIENTATION=+